MPIASYIGLGILFIVMAISFIVLGGLFIWSVLAFWFTLNPDLLKRHRQLEEYRRRLDED
jgi:hypothetical protein